MHFPSMETVKKAQFLYIARLMFSLVFKKELYAMSINCLNHSEFFHLKTNYRVPMNKLLFKKKQAVKDGAMVKVCAEYKDHFFVEVMINDNEFVVLQYVLNVKHGWL